MRLVGKTCKGHTVMSRGAQLEDKASQLNLIGITAWGIVANRSELIKKRVSFILKFLCNDHKAFPAHALHST